MEKENQNVSPDILDEVWTLMRYATVTKKNTDIFMNSMPQHFEQECCVIDEADEDADAVNRNDSSSPDKAANGPDAIHEAADILAEIGDNFCRESNDDAKLIDDIHQYLIKVSREIDDELDSKLSLARPPEGLFKISLVSVAYSMFKSKLQSFLGVNDGVDKIAIVTHVARGVAAGFKDSNMAAVNLVSALAYKFVSERYQSILKEHGSVANLAKSVPKPGTTG